MSLWTWVSPISNTCPHREQILTLYWRQNMDFKFQIWLLNVSRNSTSPLIVIMLTKIELTVVDHGSQNFYPRKHCYLIITPFCSHSIYPVFKAHFPSLFIASINLALTSRDLIHLLLLGLSQYLLSLHERTWCRAKRAGLGVRGPKFKFWLYHLIALWPWVSHLSCWTSVSSAMNWQW